MNIFLPEEVERFLKLKATIVNDSNGSEYYYLPYWYEKKKDSECYGELSFEALPLELVNLIKNKRK